VEHAAVAGERLSAAIVEIAPSLFRHGFQLSEGEGEKGSGGHFATAAFSRADRRLHVWLRQNSLSVNYELGDHRLDHASYMRELLGPGGGNRFPSYSDDVEAAFRALRYDLEQFAGDFLSGSGDDYLRCWAAANEDSGSSGVQRLVRIGRRLHED
jgi:hypothetical protein